MLLTTGAFSSAAALLVATPALVRFLRPVYERTMIRRAAPATSDAHAEVARAAETQFDVYICAGSIVVDALGALALPFAQTKAQVLAGGFSLIRCCAPQ